MRVLLTTDTAGGVWTFTRELTDELLRRGHAVALVSFGRAPSRGQARWCAGVEARHANTFSYTPSSAPLEWMQNNRRARVEGMPVLLAVADRFRPDLIHSSQFCFGDVPLSIPTVITAHSDVFSWADSCRPEGMESSAWLTHYRLLVQDGLDAAAAIVAPTGWMLNALRKQFSFDAPAHVILNGRSLAPNSVIRKQLQAVSVGRFWDEGKNLALLAELDAQLPILIAGEQRYEDTVAPQHSGKLQMMSALNEQAITALFRESSIYIVPSSYEPFGLAPLEAAQCGCAVLAHDIPSLREVWGEAALYFRNAEDLDRLLDELCRAKGGLESAQKKSADRARQLTGARMTEGYIAVYEEVLQARSAPVQEFASHAS